MNTRYIFWKLGQVMTLVLLALVVMGLPGQPVSGESVYAYDSDTTLLQSSRLPLEGDTSSALSQGMVGDFQAEKHHLTWGGYATSFMHKPYRGNPAIKARLDHDGPASGLPAKIQVRNNRLSTTYADGAGYVSFTSGDPDSCLDPVDIDGEKFNHYIGPDGVCRSYDTHSGYDYGLLEGTDVYPVAPGQYHNHGDYGEIYHDINGDGIYDYVTWYVHVKNLIPSQEITDINMPIGQTDSNNHLHLTVYKIKDGDPDNKYFTDPYGWWDGEDPLTNLSNGIASQWLWVDECPFNSEPFCDVPPTNSFYTHIQSLYEAGIVSGETLPAGRFYKPDATISRGETAKIAKNGAELETNLSCDPFPDVNSNDTFYEEIMTLKCEGVISGFSDGEYHPERPVTRAEMAKFVRNAFNFGVDTSCDPFPDVGTDHPFYEEITTLKCMGIVGGFSDGEYKPDRLITRAQTAKLVNESRSTTPPPSDYSYEFIAKNGPTGPVNPGEQFTVSFTLQNTGTETWTQDIVRLGTDNPQDRHSPFYHNEAAGWSGPTRIQLQETTVVPNDIGTFEALFTAPQTSNRYEENFAVVVEGVEWLASDAQLSVAVEVSDTCESGGQTTFCDVPAGHAFYDYIESIYQKGITNGCQTTPAGKYFCPDDQTPRDQMAKFVANAMRVASDESPIPDGSCSGTPPFSDVEPENKFCQHITYLKNNGVIGGFSDGTFKPSQFTTREQAAKFVANGMLVVSGEAPIADGTCNNEESEFIDVEANNKSCRHINYLKNNGVISGFSDGTFKPSQFITRAETAKIVDQFPEPTIPPTTATIRIIPADLQLSDGETGSTTVQVDAVTNFYASQFRLSFDPAIVQVVDVDPNNDGVQITAGNLFVGTDHFVAVNSVDNATGQIEFSASLRDPAVPFNGSGPLAEITWQAIAEGQSDVTFTESKLSDPDGFAVAHQRENGGITVNDGEERDSTGTVLLQGRTDHSGSDVFLLEESCEQVYYYNALAAANVPGIPHAVTDAQGNFEISPIPGYTYGCLQVFHHAYLVGQSDSFGELGTITLLGGDVTQDDLVDIFDLAYIGARYNSTDATADINGDGLVDIYDLALAANNYGQEGPMRWPLISQASLER